MPRYIWHPPATRQTLMVGGRLVRRGDAFEAPEAWAAAQPAGWVVLEADFVAEAAAEQRAVDARRKARAAVAGRVFDMEATVTAHTVKAASPDDPELAELNGEAAAAKEEPDAEPSGEEAAAAVVPKPAAATPQVEPTPPAKRGPGRPPKAVQADAKKADA